MDWGVQLGRRFWSLKLWKVIRYFGQEGLAARIREHIRLGQLVASWVDEDPDFERLAPTPFSTVCFRAFPGELAQSLKAAEPERSAEIESYLDQLNDAVVGAVNDSGEVFLSPTRLNGRYTIRLAIGNIRSDEKIVTRTWQLLREATSRLDNQLRPAELV